MRATPALASYWAELRDYLVWDVIGREATDEYKADTDADPHWEWAKAPEVRDAVRPVIAELARVASFLSSAGISVGRSTRTSSSRTLSRTFCSERFCVLEQARQRRLHTGRHAQAIPSRSMMSQHARGDGLSCWALFEAWVNSAKRAGSSVRRMRGVFIEMQAKFRAHKRRCTHGAGCEGVDRRLDH